MFITVMYLQTNIGVGFNCELEKVASKTDWKSTSQQINAVSHEIYSPKMYEEQPAIIDWLFSYKKQDY